MNFLLHRGLIFSLILGILIAVWGCRKRPLISFRSNKSRLVNDWKYDKVFFNGTDVTTTYLTTHPKGIEFYEDDTYLFKPTNPDSVAGKWEFVANKTMITLAFTSWKIKKLKTNALWLTEKIYDDEYEYRLVVKQ